jgi:hypothetical protein
MKEWLTCMAVIARLKTPRSKYLIRERRYQAWPSVCRHELIC